MPHTLIFVSYKYLQADKSEKPDKPTKVDKPDKDRTDCDRPRAR